MTSVAPVLLAHYRLPVCGFGEFESTVIYSEESGRTRLRIDRADPRILIPRAVLHLIMIPSEDTSTDVAVFDPGPDADPYLGGILHIYGTNRNVVYRIAEPLAPPPGQCPDTYVAELAPG